MKSYPLHLSVFLLIVAFAACSGKSPALGNAVTEEQINDIKIDEDEPEVVKPDLSTPELQFSYMLNSGDWEVYREGILPQMSEDAPEYCRKILECGGKRFIIVDKAKMKLFLYDPYGNVEKSYRIACAKNFGTKHKKGDSRTTEGCFEVKSIHNSTDWLFTDDNGYTSPAKGQYGPRFIRLNIPYIGIHGTASPGSIGRRCSHGCIRVTNDNILELVEFVEPGMPVIISPGPRDMAVNQSEGSPVLAVSTEPGTPKATPGKGSMTTSSAPIRPAYADVASPEEINSIVLPDETFGNMESEDIETVLQEENPAE